MNIAIIGATGLVGRTFLQIIEERGILFDQLYLYASKRSAGTEITFKGINYKVLELKTDQINDKQIDFALFSAGGSVSTQYAQDFVDIGAVVIDNSSAFRMDPNVPLVVPEVNPDDMFLHHGIISNPNCSTIQSVLPLSIIDFYYHVKRVDYTTYQAVSGSGQHGLDELKRTQNGETPQYYPHPIYNNVLPHIDRFQENGFTYEEQKMIQETQKILHRPKLQVSATCVRVPVEHAHSVSMIIETNELVSLEVLRKQLAETAGIVVQDNPQNQEYPNPKTAVGTDMVYVGRLRKDPYNPMIIHLFCTADNIRKGAALNAVQIMEMYQRRGEENV